MERWIERHRASLLGAIVVAALVGLVLFEARRPDPAPLLPTSLPAVEGTAAPAPGPIRVYVTGAVAHPGVVSLPAGSIVQDAVAAAGGATAEADLERVNLAQAVQGGSHIHVARRGEGLSTAAPAGLPSRLNINTADAASLEALPGIGPELAGRIVAYRQAHGPFAAVDALLDVPGIGAATLAGIRDLITTN